MYFSYVFSLADVNMLVLFSENTAAVIVMNSSAEASTSAIHSREGDSYGAVATTLSKKKSRSPVWHFFNTTEQRLSKGILLAKCTLRIPPKPIALIGINNTTNMIQHLLRKHKSEYIVIIGTGQKVIILMMCFINLLQI